MTESFQIEVADSTLVFRTLSIDDHTPTGAQLAIAAGFRSADSVSVLHFLPSGELEDVRPTEVVDLRHAHGRFIVVESDRSFRLLLDGQRLDWPSRVISGAALRKLGNLAADIDLYLERTDQADHLVADSDLVELGKAGVESFVSRKRTWKLNVQGVTLDVDTPSIVVRKALIDAGFDPDQGWQIFLKVSGQPKESVQLDSTIDVRRPGIEKLRLTPTQVNNGRDPSAPSRAFALLEGDEAHLARIGLKWETVIEQERRWLLIHDYPVPPGYTVSHTMLALEIPPTYPGAQIYGFYAYPPLALASARVIESTQMRGVLLGVEFHGWSRNRGPAAPWKPDADCVATHLALVDAALTKEVEG